MCIFALLKLFADGRLLRTFFKMEILTHPRELTRENLEIWRKEFVKKIGRTTTRTDVDRLILAVDRRTFVEDDIFALFPTWTKVIFEDRKGKVTKENGSSEEFKVSEFERKILERNQYLEKREIAKSELKEEQGEWQLDKTIKEISFGGEAIVLEEIIAGENSR